MSRNKVFASIFYLHPYPLSDRHLSYERMIPLSPPQANKIEPGFVCFFFYRLKAIRNHRLPFLLTNKHSLPFPFSIPPKFTCLSADKREHMTEKGKCLYYLYRKLNGQKKNPCFIVFSFRRLHKGFTTVDFPEEYARMRWRKASFGGEQVQYRITKSIRLQKNTREQKSGRFRKRFSAKLRFALVFFSAFQFGTTAYACLAERSDATCHRQAHAVVSTVILSMCSPSD